MPLINWDDSMSVRLPAMDNQHKRLVAMINELHDAMSQGRGREALKDILNRLNEYVATHFRDEERYMQSVNYPKLEAHKSEHQKFTKRVQELTQSFRASQVSLTIDTMKFLQEWLVNHIKRVDQQYAPAAAVTK
mgnify:CR=1 FL=1